uniref:Uncharacterized protein n=1 Tax=Meloidogyne enterolobii TaxID=390850 RepID=A0A6V7TNM3_MELEN|nr:unnamed protein product [Meloidogyne enterolobii]
MYIHLYLTFYTLEDKILYPMLPAIPIPEKIISFHQFVGWKD